MQRTIVIIQGNEWTILVNPCAPLANALEAVPNPIAKIKIEYGSRVFTISYSYFTGKSHFLTLPYGVIPFLFQYTKFAIWIIIWMKTVAAVRNTGMRVSPAPPLEYHPYSSRGYPARELGECLMHHVWLYD